jgi:hypothetical protein
MKPVSGQNWDGFERQQPLSPRTLRLPGPILWSGTVNMPAAQQGHQISSAIQRYRLVIKEFETLPADRTGLETSLRIGPPFSLLWSTKRLVYADQIEL